MWTHTGCCSGHSEILRVSVEAKTVTRWSLIEDFHRVDCVNITCSVFTLAPSPKSSYFTHLRLFQSFMMTWFKNSKCLTDGLTNLLFSIY